MRVIAALMKGEPVEWPEHLDEEKFLEECIRHGAVPLIAWRGRQAGLPVFHRLQAIARVHAAQEVLRRRELDALFERFDEARLPVLVFKGEALARTLYPDPSLRPRCDTDVLIEREALADAERVLHDAGFREEPSSGGETISRQRTWSRTDSIGFRHAIDLHWALSNRARYADVLAFEELWSRGTAIHGPHVRIPSDSDSLLIAALHLAAHHRGEERLIWIYDIHLLRNASAQSTWELERGLALADEWFGEGQAGLPVLHQKASAWRDFVEDLRFTPRLGAKLRIVREHLLPPGDYVMRKYGAKSRALLPVLYVRRAVMGTARLLLR